MNQTNPLRKYGYNTLQIVSFISVFSPRECYKRSNVKNIFQDLVLFWFWGCNKLPHFLPLRSLFYYRPAGTNSFDPPREHRRPFFFSPQNVAKIYRVIQSVSCTEKNLFVMLFCDAVSPTEYV
jgi:hypothetical protein